MSPFDEVAEARVLLEEALALFDGSKHGDEDAPRAIARLASELRRMTDPARLREQVVQTELERFDDELEELVRLNAVLVEAIRLDQASLVERLKAVRVSQREIGYYDAAGTSGVRCDVSG